MIRYTRLRNITASLTSNTTEASSTLVMLDYVQELLEEAERTRYDLVQKARAEGASWTKIGQQIGMSKQAAQQRYGPKPKPQPDADQLTIDSEIKQ